MWRMRNSERSGGDGGGDRGDDDDSPLKYSVKNLTWDSSYAIGCVMRTLYLS